MPRLEVSGASMRRRDFIRLASGAAAWPLAARAQQSRSIKRIGILLPFSENDQQIQTEVQTFRAAIELLGWNERSNVKFEARWAGGDAKRLQSLAKELVELPCDVILTRNTPVTAAVRRETSTIPIVFVLVADPVGDGFVQSLARPGGNITGFSTVEPSLGGKWLELLREIAPQVGQVGVMFDPNTAPNGGSFYFHLIETAAASIAVRVSTAPVSDDKDIFRTIEASAKERNFGVIVMPDQTTTVRRMAIIEAAARYRVPTIYPYLFAADEGGLISYGFEVADIYRQAAGYIDRILRGSKPDELPVQAPVRFQLIINLNAAKSLGLVVPPIMQQRADKVIE